MTLITGGPVDGNGNISFNRDEGLILPIFETDEAGEVIDISELPRYFSIQGGRLYKELGADPDNATGRRLVLTTAELKVVQSTASFTYLDTQGLVPISLWEGIIYERNTQ